MAVALTEHSNSPYSGEPARRLTPTQHTKQKLACRGSTWPAPQVISDSFDGYV